MNFTSQISVQWVMRAESIDELLASSWASIATDAISVPAAIVTILLVWRINVNQAARCEEGAMCPSSSLAS